MSEACIVTCFAGLGRVCGGGGEVDGEPVGDRVAGLGLPGGSREQCLPERAFLKVGGGQAGYGP